MSPHSDDDPKRRALELDLEIAILERDIMDALELKYGGRDGVDLRIDALNSLLRNE